ncbi:NAD(P)/FAD-dependent oxidoreductase [Roseateles sp.]|uniref:NAD(P)/FAD-dependent oxidoreductase n=1 Tax=Roseateles sp. TaxID=1971397 RepID=UPI002E016643|nr:NAD(P)/FAD-dependent oxidoreductase [Roseateles sp.]
MSHTLIIGAGPAGLTAGLELLRAGYPQVTLLEATDAIGGISKTVNYKGNRIDIGGHRFFSKSDWVMDWWRDVLPVAKPANGGGARLAYQGQQRLLGGHEAVASETDDAVMLIRSRQSRIYFGGNFFDYPLKPGMDLVAKMGPLRCLQFAGSYMAAAARPIAPERTLEDFFINRFGRQLYLQFFKDYTEKVWGVPCRDISADWGAQRIKSLSIGSAAKQALKKIVTGSNDTQHTSLIESFLYPKYGPGQMWETAAAEFERRGGRLLRGWTVDEIHRQDRRVERVVARDAQGQRQGFDASAVVSTMPIRELAQALRPAPDAPTLAIAGGLEYRDFITVGLLYRRMSPKVAGKARHVSDNWIYIQEPGVKVGRVQVFNNWSPYMVADPDTVWLGLEFFARDDDELWALSEDALKALAVREMQQLGLADEAELLDATVLRQPKAYPGYFGAAFQRFDELRAWLDGLDNLFLCGRNGMHRYNNQDHSMMSARLAAEAIMNNGAGRNAIWDVNIDDDYHEEDGAKR